MFGALSATSFHLSTIMSPKGVATLARTRPCTPPHKKSDSHDREDGPPKKKRRSAGVLETSEVSPQRSSPPISEGESHQGVVNVVDTSGPDVTIPTALDLPDADISLANVEVLATASLTMSSHSVIRVLLDKVRARLSKATEGDIAAQLPLEICRTNGWAAHWVGPTVHTALKSTGTWHGAINLFWLHLPHGYSIYYYWRNIVYAFQHFYAAGAREVPMTVHRIVAPTDWERRGQMNETDCILKPFGVKILGGHELIWGW